MLQVILDDNEAEWNILKLSKVKDMFGLPMGLALPDQQHQDAFVRGLQKDWYRFIDLTPISTEPAGGLYRVYMLTPAGVARREALAIIFATKN